MRHKHSILHTDQPSYWRTIADLHQMYWKCRSVRMDPNLETMQHNPHMCGTA